MPYNPGSAYPRKTVYVPPTYGEHAFQRAVNAPDVSSAGSYGKGVLGPRGRGVFAGQAAAARGAASMSADAASGFAAIRQPGVMGDLQNRFMEQQGRKQNRNGSATKPDEMKSPAELAADQLPSGDWDGQAPQSAGSAHGNPAAQQKRAAAGQLADSMVEGVTTGDLPGFTGRANTRKGKSTRGQMPLPF